jgi:hypothetical protein
VEVHELLRVATGALIKGICRVSFQPKCDGLVL